MTSIRSRHTLQRVIVHLGVWSALGICVIFAAAHLRVSVGAVRFLDNLMWTLSHGAAAVLAWLGVIMARRRNETASCIEARRWFAWGLSSYAIGQLLFDVQVAMAWMPLPAPSDGFYLACGPCLALGFWHCLRDTPMKRALALDVVALTAAAVSLTLALYVARPQPPGVLQLLVLAAYPISLLGAAAVCLIAIPALVMRPHAGWVLLLTGLIGIGACWMYWNSLILFSMPPDGSWLNFAFAVTGWMMGMGAACWRAEASSSVAWQRTASRVLFLLPLLVVAVAVYSVARMWWAETMPRLMQIAVLLGAAVVMVMAVLRQSLMLSERQQAQQALAKSETELRAIFDHSPVGIGLLDTRGYMVRFNRATSVLTGYDQDDARRLSLMEVTHPEDRAATAQAYQRLAQGEPTVTLEKRYIRKDGSIMWARATLSQVDIPGEPQARYIGLVEDITQRQETEQALHVAQQNERRLREEFTQHLLNAQEQERQRLANELHDSIGQTLSLIKNRTYLALEQPGLPDGTRRQLDGMLQLTADAIVEVRGLAHHLRPLHIEELGLTASLSSLLQRFAESSGLRVESHIENVDDAFAAEHLTHVYRMLQEALANVLKHAGAKRVTVRVERDLREVRLFISDDGCGFAVDARHLHHGLGLTSMAERAQMLHGRLSIDSSEGGGTRLMMELPLTRDTAALETVHAAVSALDSDFHDEPASSDSSNTQ